MATIEAHLRRVLHTYAVELRKLAYMLPHGVGEHGLLHLSERMAAAATETPERYRTAAADVALPDSRPAQEPNHDPD